MTQKPNNITEDNTSENFGKLSIQVSLNGLSFCISDTVSNTVSLTEQVNFPKPKTVFGVESELKALFERHHIQDRSFSEVMVIHRNGFFSFVPKALFDPEALKSYLLLNVKLMPSDHLTYDELENHDIVNVYAPFVSINNYLFGLFGEFEFRHSGTVMANTLLSGRYHPGHAPVLFVHVAQREMELTAISQKKLLLYNSFETTSKEDFIYYILFVMEQLQMDTQKTEVKLFGAIEEDDPYYEALYKYVKNVSIFVPANQSFTVSDQDIETIDFTTLSTL